MKVSLGELLIMRQRALAALEVGDVDAAVNALYGRAVSPKGTTVLPLLAAPPNRIHAKAPDLPCRHCGSKPSDPPFPIDQCPRCEPRSGIVERRRRRLWTI